MQAAIRNRYGSPDVVRVEDLEKPVPDEGEVLVRTRAASVNRADLDGIQPRPGFIRLFMGLRAPRQPQIGFDVAGVVESVGTGVTRFRAGDEVFTDLFASGSTGAFAEYVAAPEKGWQPIPRGMSFEDAATLGHSSVLALQGLRTRKGREVQAGDKVLVSGASGNVGPFAVQIAKAMGAEVTGVASTDKVDFVRSLSAPYAPSKGSSRRWADAEGARCHPSCRGSWMALGWHSRQSPAVRPSGQAGQGDDCGQAKPPACRGHLEEYSQAGSHRSRG